jgi:hypothetical protein
VPPYLYEVLTLFGLGGAACGFPQHVPSLPPFLGNWGFKYSDIVSVAYDILERPERWFDHGKYLDSTAHRGCYLPYVDYHFEYPPLMGLLWAFSTCLSGGGGREG